MAMAFIRAQAVFGVFIILGLSMVVDFDRNNTVICVEASTITMQGLLRGRGQIIQAFSTGQLGLA
jgi:hypothetical protein